MTRVLVTGAAGAVGSALLGELGDTEIDVIATDVTALTGLAANVRFLPLDVRGGDADRIVGAEKPDVVIHLASIIAATSRSFAFEVDVVGTRNIIDACITHGVKRLIVTSSGAAYGYHPDNPAWLTETDAVRGNVEFSYSDHKRQVEEMLTQTRDVAPDLEQVVLRVGTILGEGMENQITALFHKPRLLALTGNESPFVFIWNVDLARILKRAISDGPAGIYNVAGDGALGVTDLSRILNKPILRLPAWLLKSVLAVARPLKLSRYGPEQVRFLQYRPVLDNTALKTVFGYAPELSSAQTFELWRKAAGI